MATTAGVGSAAPPLDDSVTGSLAEWHALRATIQGHPLAVAPAPTLFTDTPAVMVGHINRAYYRGGTAFRTNDPNLEPLTPRPRSSDCTTSMWAYYWQGYNSALQDSQRAAKDAAIAAAAATPQAAQEDRVRAPKVSDPETYSGDREQFREFMTQLHLVFGSDPRRYTNDQSKLAYAASFLRGAAKRWFTPHVDAAMGRISFADYSAFVRALQAAFDDPDASATAERRLRALRQGSDSCATYHSKFVSYMAILGWDDASRIPWFRNGLRPEVKDLLVGRDAPAAFGDYVQLCIRLDNSWRARQAERRSEHAPSSASSAQPPGSSGSQPQASPQPRTTATGSTPGPMDVSAGRRGPLSDREKAHRRANNLCMYCGKSGHFITACPEVPDRKSKSKRRINAIEEDDQDSDPEPTGVALVGPPSASALYVSKN